MLLCTSYSNPNVSNHGTSVDSSFILSSFTLWLNNSFFMGFLMGTSEELQFFLKTEDHRPGFSTAVHIQFWVQFVLLGPKRSALTGWKPKNSIFIVSTRKDL